MSMEQFSRFAAPATAKLRQLQKIVQDISKNEGSLINKLRRHKVKPGPKVPDRDYPVDYVEDRWERWSDESDDYEEPHEDADGYEDPPTHSLTTQVFTPSSSSHFFRDHYVDSCRNRPDQLPRKPLTAKATKPRPPEPRHMASDEEDYIDPEMGNQDNDIKPTAKLLQTVYEVSLPEENIPPVSRFAPNTQTQPLQKKVSTRLISPHVILEPSLETKCEAFDPDIRQTVPRMNCGRPPPPKAFTADFSQRMIPLPQIWNSHRQADLSLMVTNGLQDMDKKSDIHRQPWYANTCSRKTAEEVLIQSDRDGSFLVRKSTGQDAQQPYTLAVLFNGRVYNIPVRFIQATQQYALGREKKGEQHFNSVSKIIENHLQNPLVLIDSQNNTRDITKLQHAVRPQVVTQP